MQCHSINRMPNKGRAQQGLHGKHLALPVAGKSDVQRMERSWEFPSAAPGNGIYINVCNHNPRKICRLLADTRIGQHGGRFRKSNVRGDGANLSDLA